MNQAARSYLLWALLLLLIASACGPSNSEPMTRDTRRVLLVSGPEKDSLPAWDPTPDQALQQWPGLTAVDQYDVYLQEDSLQQMSAVVLWGIREDELSVAQRNALERYVAAGGGLTVIDRSAITPYLWHWYQQLWNTTPETAVQHFGPFEAFSYSGGRVLRAHAGASMNTEQWEQALQYAIGDNSYDYSEVAILKAPEWNQFTRKVLDDDIYEPMEMVVLPFGEVLFLERRGKIKLYDPAAEATRVIAEFDVCTEGNYEDGLHGLALDPGYGKQNHYLYMYYSPAPCDTPYQYLSRFVFKNQKIERDSEIVMLRVLVQRETCCHSGGSVEFGPDGLLYLSTGDNTSSKESDGYTPIDERPGRGPFDAQKSSGNTNDLRGKILRIRPEADGTYSIPDGNLFPRDGSGGRPEIYTMGCRNPFRITIDAKHNTLYWGDVGPDVGQDGRYGPQSYDEWNQAKGPGYFGWPYFVADNKAYPDRDFATDELGPLFDPQKPINQSPNNTGARELPPAQPAMIWYPYGASREFPLLGQGSRSAMAGPFYYPDQLMPLSTVKFPDYYHGKWFIFEWARSWIKVVTFDENEKPIQMEDFMPDMELSKPIELEFGPDGALYILEYGNQYFMNNPDARLVRLEFARSNRPPNARLQADQLAGSVPHTVHFSAAESFDYDAQDSLRYLWSFTGAGVVQAEGPEVAYTFMENGQFTPTVRVVDSKGAEATASVQVEIGNTPPRVVVNSRSNRSFFFDDQARWDYQVEITDKEDQAGGGIESERAIVNYTYVPDAKYLQELRTGKASLPDGPLQHLEGARLIQGSDCSTCHHETQNNIGPAFRRIAERYTASDGQVATLATKVISGGNGNWGEAMMSGHPQILPADAQKMVRYILALGNVDRKPLQGEVTLSQHQADGQQTGSKGGYVLTAAYRDNGYKQARPVTTRLVSILRHPQVEAETADAIHLGEVPTTGSGAYGRVNLKANSYLSFKGIDLDGIHQLELQLARPEQGRIELRVDRPDGTLIGSAALPPRSEQRGWSRLQLPVNASGMHDLYFIFIAEQEFLDNHGGTHHPKDMFSVDWVRFDR